MPASKILVSTDGPVTTIHINRPEHRNAVDPETAQQLRLAFREFDADPASSVAILCGSGTTFCAGYDLKSLATADIAYEPEGDGPMGPTRMLLSKPVIAAIEGYAVAGGLELALWCDLRVASATAVFGVFCRRWGVPLVDGGTVRLARLIGQSRAMDMILTGRPVGAEESLVMGLANRLTPEGAALATASDLARDLARFPQTCLRTDRLSCHCQWDATLDEALRFEAREGERPLRDEASRGAARFASGLGRRGNFDAI